MRKQHAYDIEHSNNSSCTPNHMTLFLALFHRFGQIGPVKLAPDSVKLAPESYKLLIICFAMVTVLFVSKNLILLHFWANLTESGANLTELGQLNGIRRIPLSWPQIPGFSVKNQLPLQNSKLH